MKILFISSRFPSPSVHGDQLRSYHILRLLRLRQHRVTLVTPLLGSQPKIAEGQVDEICERWIAVRIPRWQILLNLAKSIFLHLPLQVSYFCPPSLIREVQRITAQEHFDLVHIQTARAAPVISVLTNAKIPTVVDFIDAFSINMRRRAAKEPIPVKWLFELEARRMSAYEREIVYKSNYQIVSSKVDMASIGNFETLCVIPNGVNVHDYPYIEDNREEHMIVFTGHMSYFPNTDAAVYFATEIFPIIRSHVPNALFFIVGADPPPRVQRLARIPGICVTGRVPRIQDYLMRATVAVAPMRSGSGILNKILEAMASGAPVVATSYAIGGLEAIEGEHLLVADDTREIAEHVINLFLDPKLRRYLARNARRLVEEKYTWERAVTMLEEVYQLAIRR